MVSWPPKSFASQTMGSGNAGYSFSSLERHNFLMDGNVHPQGTPMAKKYVALDPRTGKPIRVGRSSGNDVPYEPVQGPWSALLAADAMSLAEGSLSEKEVRWKEEHVLLKQRDGVRALSTVPQSMLIPAHRLLLEAFEHEEEAVRVAALEVLPEFAVRKSDELFDWLSVLLDDDATSVRRAASEALARAAPTFPSGIRSSLSNELRSKERHRSACAWKGLEALSKAWPDVVADHVDGLLLESDVELRRKAAKMLATIAARKTSVVWDLVSWALNDEDVQVRRIVAKSLPKLGQKDVRMGTVFAERALVDTDSEVRLSAVKTIQRLNRDHGRARDLIIAGARSNDLRVRQACVDLLPKLMSEEALRVLVDDLLKTETDQKLIEKLMEYRFDASLEGSEEEKNAALSPALPIPELDKEVLMAQGKRIGMAPILQDTVPKSDVVPAQEPPVSRTPAPERRPTQDELMGYHDDDDDFDPMFDEPYQ